MRVLHLTDRLSTRGGADWHLLGVLHALVRRGVEATLAVGVDDKTVTDSPCPVVSQPGLEARTRQDLVTLDGVLDAERPDLLHLHNVANPSVLEWATSLSLPTLMTVQDHRVFCPGRGKWRSDGQVCGEPMSRHRCAACFSDPVYFESIYRLTSERLDALCRFDAVTVLSHYMKRELVAVGVSADRIEVIPPFVHGLDLQLPPTGPPCLLFVGRLVDTKGPQAAVEAWRRSGVRLPLVVAGTGSARQTLARLAPDVELLGWVAHQELAPLYQRARALLFPSRWQEPFGIVGLEALTLGTPVAAWDSGGVRDWHPGPLVPWGDVEGLAETTAQLASKGAAPPCNFGEEKLMDSLESLYAAVASGKDVL